jgi:hypothetical protein
VVHPKVKAGSYGAAGGTVVGTIITIVLYYLLPIVPADIHQPVILLVTIAIPAICAAVGSLLAGYFKSGLDR